MGINSNTPERLSRTQNLSSSTSTPAVPGLVYLSTSRTSKRKFLLYTVHYRALLVYYQGDSQNGSSAVRSVTRYGLR